MDAGIAQRLHGGVHFARFAPQLQNTSPPVIAAAQA
jgi:hypothetical protein